MVGPTRPATARADPPESNGSKVELPAHVLSEAWILVTTACSAQCSQGRGRPKPLLPPPFAFRN